MTAVLVASTTMLGFAMAWGLSALMAGLYVQSLKSVWTVSSEFFIASQLFLALGWLIGTTLLPQVSHRVAVRLALAGVAALDDSVGSRLACPRGDG